MGKTAFIFPGQGAQYAGMGKDFYHEFEEARRVYELAGTAAGLDVKTICFEQDERLHQTEYTQIAILATEVAILEMVKRRGISAEVSAGLSLGEYGALAAGECMGFRDLFQIIRKRGQYMQNAYPSGGAMTAVLGLEAEAIEAVCEQIGIKTGKVVAVANYNCPGQTVITGEASAVEMAAGELTALGARKCVPLHVSGPFHSALLADAGQKLQEALSGVDVKSPCIPYLSNVHAQYVTQCGEIKELLARQIYSPVRWQQIVERMIADGVDTFLEIGPGRTLSGFVKKIDRNVRVYNVATVEDLEKVTEELAC